MALGSRRPLTALKRAAKAHHKLQGPSWCMPLRAVQLVVCLRCPTKCGKGPSAAPPAYERSGQQCGSRPTCHPTARRHLVYGMLVPSPLLGLTYVPDRWFPCPARTPSTTPNAALNWPFAPRCPGRPLPTLPTVTLHHQAPLGSTGLKQLLADRGVRCVPWSGWRALDEHELAAGRAAGRVREKVVEVEQMLRVAGV